MQLLLDTFLHNLLWIYFTAIPSIIKKYCLRVQLGLVFNGCQTNKNLWVGYSTNILECFLMWVFLQLFWHFCPSGILENKLLKYTLTSLTCPLTLPNKPASRENSVIFVMFSESHEHAHHSAISTTTQIRQYSMFNSIL